MSTNRISTQSHPSAANLRPPAPSAARAGQQSSVTATGERPALPADAISTASSGAFEAVRGETHRIDSARIQELSDKIESGHYKVDAGALADRILDDALGPDAQ